MKSRYYKRKVARLNTLEGTQCESEERWHSTLATLFQVCDPPGVFLTGSKLDAHPRTPGPEYKTRGSFGAQTVTLSVTRASGDQYFTHPPFLIPRKAQNQLPPPQSGSCLLQTASFLSCKSTTLPALDGTGKRPQAGDRPALRMGRGAGGTLPPLLSVNLELASPEEEAPPGGRGRCASFSLLPADGGGRGRRRFQGQEPLCSHSRQAGQ